ncbi:MAG: aryl-sulfate sulfotransferase [Phycisphaerae bacterium]|jgi:hypothetical protein
MTAWRRLACVVCCIAGALLGCERVGPAATQPVDGAQNGQAAAGNPGERVRALQALPYAGFVAREDDEPGDGVVLHDPQRACPGYSLYTVHDLCTAELIDTEGTVVRSWRADGGGHSWSNVELLSSGDLLVVGTDAAAQGDASMQDELRYVARFDWSGRLLWKRFANAHHDIEQWPDGSLLTLTFRRLTMRVPNQPRTMRDDQLTLLDAHGNVLNTRSLMEAIVAAPETFPLGRAPIINVSGEPWVDVLHCNSIQRQPFEALRGRHAIYGADSILVCFRHQDRIAVFDWATGGLLWAWGRGELSGPHDAQYLENGDILVFDNGIREKRSRVVQLNPLSGEIVWQYQADPPQEFFSLTKGSCQRLPNGNTLIANSDSGEAFEVTPAGETVWRFLCPHHNEKGERATIARMKRYDAEWIDRLLAETE